MTIDHSLKTSDNIDQHLPVKGDNLWGPQIQNLHDALIFNEAFNSGEYPSGEIELADHDSGSTSVAGQDAGGVSAHLGELVNLGAAASAVCDDPLLGFRDPDEAAGVGEECQEEDESDSWHPVPRSRNPNPELHLDEKTSDFIQSGAKENIKP